ncbi:MAG: steroid Delta-isomerase [Mycobacterium sp.]|jgi:steroid delta-isomerase|nr:steroid Delta-isomerase [Mycobacterium sp.]
MPSTDPSATVNRYLELLTKKGVADEITALYTDDATIEDPIGSDVRRGRDAVHEFYAAFDQAEKKTDLLALRVGGSEAAFSWRLSIDFGNGSGTVIEPISVMTFNEDAKITSMRAFWSPSDAKPL